METNGNKLQAEYRVRARRLLGQLRSTDSKEAAGDAAARFRRLHSFSKKSLAQISQDAQLKHALTVIAVERGYDSWKTLKQAIEGTSASTRVGETDPFGIALLAGWFGGDRGVRGMFRNGWGD